MQRKESYMYVQVVAEDSFGVAHPIAITTNYGVLYAALRAAERDLQCLLARERNAVIRAEYKRMLGLIRELLAEGATYDGVHAN
jgi:hypothetical protein